MWVVQCSLYTIRTLKCFQILMIKVHRGKFQLLNQMLGSLLDGKAFYIEHDHLVQIVFFFSICFNFKWISGLYSLRGIFNIVHIVKYLLIAFPLPFFKQQASADECSKILRTAGPAFIGIKVRNIYIFQCTFFL